MAQQVGSVAWQYSERDVILYALSIGCGRQETRYIYENDPDFGPLPTFAVLPLHTGAIDLVDIGKLIPNYSPMMLLHGEQYLELMKPFPPAATVKTEAHVVDVLDKGKAALIILGLITTESATGVVLAKSEVSSFVRGSGGFGKTQPNARDPEATAPNNPPPRPPDAVASEPTGDAQAALYRLNGDTNPLHVDAEFAALGGFDRPILHGLCTFGIAAKHVLKAFGDGEPARFRSIKVRFAKHVFPGETLRTEMWQVAADRVVFRVKVVERDAVVISNAAVRLHPVDGRGGEAKL